MKRFAIIGCGTAGLATAIHLARAGHDVNIFERFVEPAAVGAGILIQPSGASVLQQLDLLDPLKQTAARIEALDGRLADGKRIMDVVYRDYAPDVCGLGVHRANLLAVLHEAARVAGATIHCAAEITALERGPAKARLRSADGSVSDEFDAVVIANGAQSRLRDKLPIQQSCTPYPWGALWTILPLAQDDPLPNALVQRYDRTSVMIGLMPTGVNPADNQPCVSFFWSLRQADRSAWNETSLEEWKSQVLGYWPEIRWAMDRITSKDQLSVASYADVRMRQWHDGNVVVIGDAAHAMSPQLGQGANLALIDAACLAQCVAENEKPDEAFARYTQQRKKHLRFYQIASRGLTPLFQSDSRFATWVRDLGFPLGNRFAFTRREAVRVVAGLKTGWLFDRSVDENPGREESNASDIAS